MSTANDIKAGAAYVELYVKNNIADPLARIGLQVQAWGQRIAMFGTRVLAAGTAASTALISTTASFASSGTQLERASRQTGVAVEALSELRYAAEQNGLTFEDLTNLFKGQGNFLSQIRAGSQEAGAMLAALGMNARDLQGLSPEQVFERMADGIARIPDPTRRAELAMKVFGEAGLKALPMLDRGAQGIEAWREQARALGLQVSGSDARAALQLTQAWGQLVAQVKAVVFALGAALAPVLKTTSDLITPYVSAIVRWTQENRALTRTVLAVVLGVTAAGVAIIAFGLAVSAVGAAIAVVGIMLGAMLSPIGLVSAAVGGLVFLFRNELARAFEPALAALAHWWGRLQETFNAVLSLLSAGEIQGAWELAAIELEGIWNAVTAAMTDTWQNFVANLRMVWNNASTTIASTLVQAFAAAWQEVSRMSFNASAWILRMFPQLNTAGTMLAFGGGNQTWRPDQSMERWRQGMLQQLERDNDQANNQIRGNRQRGQESTDWLRMYSQTLRDIERQRMVDEANWTEALRPAGNTENDPRLRNATAGLNQFAAGPVSGSFSSFALQAGLGRPDYQRQAALAAEENARLQRENNRLLQRVLEFGQ